ncbi:SipW-dependent-type signal peptide-containing protein [Salinibaculum salinum]|uniref:SipW-dependent-type signal peptide-containing protein n=1 Tax=Salinibaculum salinum TaxID=3131996 RepID=UPI0030EF2735
MPDKYDISRRKVLAGLGTIGVAGAGAGLGTSAYFSDEESFTDNSLTAGKLDLAVKADIYEYQGAANDGGQSFHGVVNGGDDVQQELTDVKPGDYSWGKFCFSIVDNPGYIWAGGELTSNDENTVTEPEADSDKENNAQTDSQIEGDGELADAIEGCLFYTTHGDYDPAEQGRPTETRAPGDEDDIILEGSLREILAALQTGVPLDGSDDDGRQAFPGDEEESFDDDERCLGFWWEVPTSVGNEIQTDSLTFDITFYAVQERHNDGSDNPFADAVLTSDPSSGTDDDLAGNEQPWITAQISAGPTTVVQIDLNGEVYGNDDNSGNSDFPEWPSNEDDYFMEANIDIDNDSIDEAANDDDFRVGYAAANSGARANAISNSSSASGNGGYIRRNTGGSSSGDSANRSDVAEEDVPGFLAFESGDQLSYTLILDWASIAADGDTPTAQLASAPGAIQVNEVFGGDGGEGVGATPNSSNDGRGDIDNVTDGSGTLQI